MKPVLLLVSLLFAPAISISAQACSTATQWIDGKTYYEESCACGTLLYPTLDAALLPLGARVRPGPSVGRQVNETYLWACGVALEWKERPETLKDCYDRSNDARARLEKELAALSPDQRPDLIGGKDLPCFGYDTNPARDDLQYQIPQMTKEQKIEGALRILMDESKGEPAWDVAWLNLKALDDPARRVKVPPLMSELESESPRTRRHAVHVLGLLGPAAKEALPDLLRLMNDSDTSVRVAALRAVGAVGGASTVPSIARRLNDSDARIVEGAAMGLNAVGHGAESAVPDLTKVLFNPALAARTREAARDALRSIGSPEALVAIKQFEAMK